MEFNRMVKLAIALTLVLIVGISYAALAQPDNNAQIIRLEVAEDGNRFAFDDSHLFDDGMPAYGSSFVTYGYLYPEGTLNGTNGVLADGSPEFPDKVLGTWVCKGWMIGDGAHTASGPWVVSTQIYNLSEEFGGATIVTEGFEIADFNLPVLRAVVGGTGEYNHAAGEMSQELLGFTEQMGVNLSVEFVLE